MRTSCESCDLCRISITSESGCPGGNVYPAKCRDLECCHLLYIRELQRQTAIRISRHTSAIYTQIALHDLEQVLPLFPDLFCLVRWILYFSHTYSRRSFTGERSLTSIYAKLRKIESTGFTFNFISRLGCNSIETRRSVCVRASRKLCHDRCQDFFS